MMKIKLEKLPPYDGTPLFCSVVEHAAPPIFSKPCASKAIGLLSWDDYDTLKSLGYNGLRAICQYHLNAVSKLK